MPGQSLRAGDAVRQAHPYLLDSWSLAVKHGLVVFVAIYLSSAWQVFTVVQWFSLQMIGQASDQSMAKLDRNKACLELCREDGHTVSIRMTYEGPDMARYIEEALATKVDAIVAAGGDGSINQV